MWENIALGGVIGLVVGILLMILWGIMKAGGSWARMAFGFEVAQRTSTDSELDEKIKHLLEPPQEEQPDGTPVRLLALLQREGRLLDFLMDEIEGAADAQIGAAVREIHAKVKAALTEHIKLEPVMAQEEETTVRVNEGFDPSSIRLVGHVTGNPPFTGTLKHAGWKVTEIRIPEPPEGQDQMVLAPAEVELAEK